MTKGSKNSGNSGSKVIATIDYMCVPVKTTVTFKGAKGGAGGKGSYQTKSRVSYGNKKSGCYRRTTATEKASTREFQRKNGTTGVKSEYKKSSTVRIEDDGGYTEVYNEQRVRNVSYSKNCCSCSCKNLLSYDDGYGEYDSDSDY